ncbi:hypothetical protein [Robertkochia flava]|uniref:hypothetical protein n=1 Tax=Robertkochia flava TaxID=3447986 RepID=UPI001CCC5529|nr:hypothetical protein [Robertkochia marina]
MRTLICCLFGVMLLSSGCKTIIVPSGSAKAPPGQVKKVTGAQSAKAYAPGQQKNKNKKN